MEGDWKAIFAVETGPEEEPQDHQPLASCNMNCLMAREVKCVCSCGGANHGALVKKDLARLDDFTEKVEADANDTYRCEACGSIFDEVPKWREGECPNDPYQHHLVKGVSQ